MHDADLRLAGAIGVGSSFSILSLFSGGGGLDLGIHRAVRGARTVVYVEREAFACEVLAARMEEGALAPAPIWTDVCTFDGRPWRGVVDCVAGGSPCQDLSVAGKRAGLDGERSGLFFQFIRIVEEVRPGYVFWENVGGATSALPRVFDAFAALGYAGKAVKLRASDVGASHQRARVFLLGKLADAQRSERRPPNVRRGRSEQGSDGEGKAAGGAGERGDSRMADAECDGRLVDGRGGPSQADRGRPLHQAEGPDARLAHGHGHGREGERRSGVLDGIGTAQRNDLDRRSGPLELADSGDARLAIGRGIAGALREAPCGNARQDAPRVDRPEWPPGPDGDWSGIDPRFFPAQPRVRRVADGVAGGLVESVRVGRPEHEIGFREAQRRKARRDQRDLETLGNDVWADRLRMLGNGVVPAQAAEAWRFLFAHLGG